jgi:hypothetical protein
MYDPASGTFLTKDSWQGDDTTPMSYNAWLYVDANPINYIDPSGHDPLSQGYVEGISVAAGFVSDGTISGKEIVYDYATMTRARFTYQGRVGGLIASASVAAYLGGITGFQYEIPQYTGPNYVLPLSHLIVGDYSGPFDGAYVGLSAGIITGGAGYFQSSQAGSIKGVFSYISLGLSVPKIPLPGEVVGFHTEYQIDKGALPSPDGSGVQYYYDQKTGQVDRGRLISDILTGNHSPIPLGAVSDLVAFSGAPRSGQIGTVLIAAYRFEQYYRQYLSLYNTCWQQIITTP